MYTHNSRPILGLKNKYKSDKKLSIQKEVLNETSFNSVGLGEIKNHIDSAEEKNMRTNQIETKITRIIDAEPKVFTVYSDANNFSEAFATHCKAILDKVVETDKIPSFGCVEVYEK